MNQSKTSIWDCNISTLLQSQHQTEWFTKQAKESYTWDINTTEPIANYLLTREEAIYKAKVINNNWPDNSTSSYTSVLSGQLLMTFAL